MRILPQLILLKLHMTFLLINSKIFLIQRKSQWWTSLRHQPFQSLYLRILPSYVFLKIIKVENDLPGDLL